MTSPSAQIHSQAIEGNTIVLGAPMDASLGQETGAVHVFERPPGGEWVQTAWLQSASAERCHRFGSKVDIAGNTLIASLWNPATACVSAPLSGLTAFERSSGNWVQTLDQKYAPHVGLYVGFDGTSLVNSRVDGAFALTRRADGSWSSRVDSLAGLSDAYWDIEAIGMGVDIHNGLAALGEVYVVPVTGRMLPAAVLWRRDGSGQWQRLSDARVAATAQRPGLPWPERTRVASGPRARVAVNEYIFEPHWTGDYLETASLRPPCTADQPVTVQFDRQTAMAVVHTGPYQGPRVYTSDWPLWESGKLHLYRRISLGRWELVSQLVASDHSPSGPAAMDSGVVVQGTRVWNSDGPTISYQFSNLDACLGHRGNWIERTPHRWAITGNGGPAYSIQTSDYVNQSGDRPGEYALLSQYRFADFDLTLKARSDETLGQYSAADYVVIFGYQDDKHYFYMMFSRYAPNNELFKVVDGVRHRIARAPRGSFTDNLFHQVDIRRRGSQIRIRFDGRDYLTVSDSSFREGAIGIGSYNDAVSFDDIDVHGGLYP